MNITIEERPGRQAVITVEVDTERMEQAIEDAWRRVLPRVVVPGFRKGKAPRPLVERMVGREAILDEAIDDLLPTVWQEVLAEKGNDLLPIADPEIQIVQRDPLVFTATVDLAPRVVLGDYSSLRLSPERVVVTDEQVHQALEQLREEQAQYIPVEHRGVRKGDIITIDISGQAETGQPVLNQTDASYLVAEETPFSIPGFLPRLEGMEIGQEKTFSVDLPADLLDHRLAGQQATITVRLKGIKEKSLPALDDELAKAYGYESLAALTDFIRSSLQKEMEQDARDRLERRLLQAIAEVSTVEFPPRLVEDEVNTLLRRRDEGLRRRGLSLDMYFRLTNTSEEQMRDQLRPIAYERVRNTLILDELAKKEGVEVQPTEVQAEIDRLITGAGNEADSVRRLFATEGQRELLHYTMVQRKLLDSLIARVTAGQPARPRAEIEAVTSPSEGKQEDRLPDGMIVAPD